MKGNVGIFVVIGILALAFIGYIVSQGFLKFEKSPLSSPTSLPLSQDPKYKDVKEKYNLSEEQLQILSTVDPEDNE